MRSILPRSFCERRQSENEAQNRRQVKESDPRLQEQRMEIMGVLLIGISVLIALSMVALSRAGMFGRILQDAVFALFGGAGQPFLQSFSLSAGGTCSVGGEDPSSPYGYWGFVCWDCFR